MEQSLLALIVAVLALAFSIIALLPRSKSTSAQPTAEIRSLRLQAYERLVLLTEEGTTYTSVAFAQQLRDSGSERQVFVIGGAEGLDPALKVKASWRLSLSPMTFPRERARLLLLEQLYRASSILQGGPYHKA